MIFGTFALVEGGIETHNDAYMLQNISAVSARRPLLATALGLAGLLTGFVVAFHDLLYGEEIAVVAAVSVVMVAIGLWLGRLQLLSRDLRGLDLGTAVYGSYRHLNRLRRETAAAVRAARQAEGRT